MSIEKIVSGGQTGVDRAALDAAIKSGLQHGGWCPAGRRAEDGVIPDCYELSETNSSDYYERTVDNVLDSDATIICLYGNKVGFGTKLTYNVCQKHQKDVFFVNICDKESVNKILLWIKDKNPRVLNVAGNRESQSVGAYEAAFKILLQVFIKLKQ
jgi:hypothetical protein